MKSEKELLVSYDYPYDLKIELYQRYIADTKYPHSFDNYLRDKFKVYHKNYYTLFFESEKDLTWFLLHV